MPAFNPLATIYSPQGQTVTYNSLASPQVSSALTSSAPTPTVFLSRLTPTTNETQLLALGSPYGHVKSARFVQRAQEGKSFGFIMFGSVAEAQNCILGLMDQGYKVGFARETLKEKLERLADPFETNVYVKNLPASYSTQALERLFAPSIIVSSKILESGNDGVLGKGVALVRLQTRDEAHSAVDALHGRILPNSQGNPLVCRFADSPAQKVVREEAARIKRKDLDSPSSSPTGSWTSSMPGGSLPDSWATPMSSPQTPNSPFLGGYQQAFNPLGLPYPNLPFFQPSAQASYLLQAHQQRAFNGLGGGGGGGQNFASFPSSAATSATSSTFGPPVGLGLTYPANNKLAAAGGGADDDSWSRIHW